MCTSFKIKFKSYASLYVSVNEDYFPLITNDRLWPNGCLIASFYGRLNPDQIYCSESPDFSAASEPAFCRWKVNGVWIQKVTMKKIEQLLMYRVMAVFHFVVGRHNLNVGSGKYLDTCTNLFMFLVLNLLIFLTLCAFWF